MIFVALSGVGFLAYILKLSPVDGLLFGIMCGIFLWILRNRESL